MLRLVPTICAALLVWAAAPAPAVAENPPNPLGGKPPVEELEQFLARKRVFSDADRRAVLALIDASVPDQKGRFKATRKSQDETGEEVDLDWLAALEKLPADTRALDEVVADVKAIRGLVATGDFDAARAILDFGFTDVGLTYRDECGRSLRNMSPRSLPAMIVASKAPAHDDKARYARYQLERLDRELPLKAIDYADSDETKIAILDAFHKVLHREAVLAVLQTVDDVSPAVRLQARTTWMGYVDGPAPAEAPKKKLQLPGGKLTDEPQPLWLNSRELAALYLRDLHETLFGELPPRGTKLVELSQKIFDFYDQRRTAARDEAFERGQALAGESKWAEAAAAFDQVLVVNPESTRRGEMAPVYIAFADQLKRDKRWADATVAYGKAHAVAPSGPRAGAALAGQLYVRGRALVAAGKDGTALFQAALEQDSGHKGAAAALAGEDPDVAEGAAAGDNKWMIYAGAAGGAFALMLLILALRRRDS